MNHRAPHPTRTATPTTLRQCLACLLLSAAPVAGWTQQPGPDPATDPCVLPVPDAEPMTQAWTARDLQNQVCAEARAQEVPLSWTLGVGVDEMPSPARDPYRSPTRHDGIRFRFLAGTVANRDDEDLPAEIYRPCSSSTCSDTPTGITVAEPPYPAVLIVHGGGSQKELHRWAAQPLAESGYIAVTFDVASGNHGSDAQDMVEWLFSDAFPFADELDRARVGITGHSQGGSTASLVGQLDDRLKAIVAWDNLTAVDPMLWADDIGVEPPAGLPITTPAIGIGADYYFTPTPYTDRPEPPPSNGEGGRGRGVSGHPKDPGYQELRAADIDTALVILRAGTHLDFTPLMAGAGSRYGEPYALYLTLAWFDRYLKGLTEPELARDAHRRLLATVFDDSADQHNLGAGYYDPQAGNQPYMIEGLSVCDRMSFYFKSRIALTAPGTGERIATEDWKSACKAGTLPTLGSPGDPDGGTPGQRTPSGSSGALSLGVLGLLGLAALRRRCRLIGR
ncbi:MAG: hypothetical protein CMP06_00430 [Xanthomonadales bacterium]|nr:hypothetical protein [Xanthomonadales bacterium]